MSIVGIDLGTTHSLIGWWQEDRGEPALALNALGSVLTPSAVSLDSQGQLLVGQAALDRLVSHPQVSSSLFKRLMGTEQAIKLGTRSFRPEELSALVIRQLLQDLEAAGQQRPQEAVISVPAYFSDAQRKATKVAGELAGLRVERLVNEPTAAALAYGLADQADDCTVAVIDLGGGTLDVSILEYFSGVMQVRASTGDRTLGGTDFDELLLNHLLTAHDIKLAKLSPSELAAVRRRVTQAKHELSTQTETSLQFSVSATLRSKTYESELTRAEFEKLSAPLLKRLTQTIERAMRDSKLTATALDNVLLVGGATRMPMIRNLVGRLFQRLPLSHINADEVVAKGAVVQGALRAERRELEDVVLTDVAPYTLGIDIAVEKAGGYEGGHFMPIIERNSPVPISRVQIVSPISDQQDTVLCHIFQGESRLVKNNVLLGKIEQRLHGDAERNVNVRFTYDINGILEVTTQVVGSEHEQRLVISGASNTMTPTEIDAALAKLQDLKVHPRNQLENSTAMARAERMYEEALGERRDHIAKLIQWFEIQLEQQDKALADAARLEMLEHLDELDSNPWT